MSVIRTPESLVVAIGLVPVAGVIISALLYPGYLDVQSVVVGLLASISFVFSIYGFSWFFGIKPKKQRSMTDYIPQKRLHFVLYALFMIAFFGTISLVNSFVEDFGFDSLFFRPDLFQSNSIVNSFGYLLYLNVFVFALFSSAKSG